MPTLFRREPSGKRYPTGDRQRGFLRSDWSHPSVTKEKAAVLEVKVVLASPAPKAGPITVSVFDPDHALIVVPFGLDGWPAGNKH